MFDIVRGWLVNGTISDLMALCIEIDGTFWCPIDDAFGILCSFVSTCIVFGLCLGFILFDIVFPLVHLLLDLVKAKWHRKT